MMWHIIPVMIIIHQALIQYSKAFIERFAMCIHLDLLMHDVFKGSMKQLNMLYAATTFNEDTV